LVRSGERPLSSYRDLLGVTERHADNDFAALQLQGIDFMLPADHLRSSSALRGRENPGRRGTGAAWRVLGVDPMLCKPAPKVPGQKFSNQDFPLGWRVMAADPDGTSGRWGCQ